MFNISIQVHHILNELVMGGMVLETNMSEIMARIEEQNKLEKQEVINNILKPFSLWLSFLGSLNVCLIIRPTIDTK